MHVLLLLVDALYAVAYDSPLPDFNAGGLTSPDKVLVVLKAQEANARFFQDLRGTQGLHHQPVSKPHCIQTSITYG